MRIGYILSCEEFTPAELLDQAILAERAGFEGLWISDHFHPWLDAQGQSPFVWSMIGALSRVTRLPVTTAVTCPTVRMHPALVAQAAATSAVLTGGRFTLGVGSGEALNEHIFGDPWPSTGERLDMVEEAVDVMRRLWAGREVIHRGTHYEVVNARLYTMPAQPPPIYMSGFGRKSAMLAGRIADGFLCTKPDTRLLDWFREGGGEGKPTQGGFKVCYGPDRDAAVRVVHERWPNALLPGELGQVLPTPRHFEQASALVTEEMVGEAIVCGPDLDQHLAAIRSFLDAGYDDVYVNQIGPEHESFFRFYGEQVLPTVRSQVRSPV